MAPTCPDFPVLKEKDPFWANAQQQQKAKSALEKVLKESEAWWVLLLAPSCLIGLNQHHSSTKSLWGLTLEGYGEAVAEFLLGKFGTTASFYRGLIFHILRFDPKLRSEVLKALLKEQIDKVAIEDQKLYETTEAL